MIKISWPFLASSLSLIFKKVFERTFLLEASTITLLSSYIAVSRLSELLAFSLVLPAMGFSPVILRHYIDEDGQKLAKILLYSYLFIAMILTIFISLFFEYIPLDISIQMKAIAPAIIAGVLLFSQTSYAGYGFIIKKQTKWIAYISFSFALMFFVLTILLSFFIDIFISISLAYLWASFFYSLVFIYFSEKIFSFSYSFNYLILINLSIALIGSVTTVNSLLSGVDIYSMFQFLISQNIDIPI